MENEELQQENVRQEDVHQEDVHQEESYVPRAKWQVWLARIALIVFIGFLIMYYTNIFRS